MCLPSLLFCCFYFCIIRICFMKAGTFISFVSCFISCFMPMTALGMHLKILIKLYIEGRKRRWQLYTKSVLAPNWTHSTHYVYNTSFLGFIYLRVYFFSSLVKTYMEPPVTQCLSESGSSTIYREFKS